MTYEELLIEADNLGLIVKEKKLLSSTGRIKGNRIAIHRNLTQAEKSGILAEELGHYYTGCGNILDQASVSNRKFLKEALTYYRAKYGTSVNVDNYVIFFEPSIGVLELI